MRGLIPHNNTVSCVLALCGVVAEPSGWDSGEIGQVHLPLWDLPLWRIPLWQQHVTIHFPEEILTHSDDRF